MPRMKLPQPVLPTPKPVPVKGRIKAQGRSAQQQQAAHLPEPISRYPPHISATPLPCPPLRPHSDPDLEMDPNTPCPRLTRPPPTLTDEQMCLNEFPNYVTVCRQLTTIACLFSSLTACAVGEELCNEYPGVETFCKEPVRITSCCSTKFFSCW